MSRSMCVPGIQQEPVSRESSRELLAVCGLFGRSVESAKREATLREFNNTLRRAASTRVVASHGSRQKQLRNPQVGRCECLHTTLSRETAQR